MRQNRRIIGLLYLTLGVLGFSFVLGYQAHSQTALSSKPGKPFIAHQRVLHFSSTQLPPIIQQETFARRSDGSFVKSRDTRSPSGETGWSVEIIDLRNRKVAFLEPFTRSVMTFYHSDAEMQEELRIQGTCATLGLAGETLSAGDKIWDDMLGYKVVQVVERWKDDTVEKWVAPDLDCYPLRKSEWSERGAHNEYTVTKLEEVEPPDSMFEVPPDYAEASPLQVEAAYAAKFPGHALLGGKMGPVVEERYRKSLNKRQLADRQK